MAPTPQGSTDVSDDGLPLASGAIGTAVVDVQARLIALGFAIGDDDRGRYGPGTAAAVTRFQAQRGLRADGICGPETWNTLVEAGFHLGQRLLYHRMPMLRGDDVAILQRRLSALGFDTGRVDGIFGPRTAQAVSEFQRNAGLVVDGTCGRDTLQALDRLGTRPDTALVAADLRERVAMGDRPRTLQGRCVAVGEHGDLAALAAEVARRLTLAGATPIVLREVHESDQAGAANAAGAELYLGLTLVADRPGVTTAYFHHPSTGAMSPAGQQLATLVQQGAEAVLGGGGEVRGMGLSILRETRMPAVVCELGPTAAVVEHLGPLAAALFAAIERWAATPCA